MLFDEHLVVLFPNCENSNLIVLGGVIFTYFEKSWQFLVSMNFPVNFFYLRIWGSGYRKIWLSSRCRIGLFNWLTHYDCTNLKHIHRKLSGPLLFFIHRTKAASNSLLSTSNTNIVCLRFLVVKNTWPFLFPSQPIHLVLNVGISYSHIWEHLLHATHTWFIHRHSCDEKQSKFF